MKSPFVSLSAVAWFAFASATFGFNVLQPGDAIIAIDLDPPTNASSSPGLEAPANVVNGNAAQKYLNFGAANSGFIVTPAGGASVLQSFRLQSANDAPERDPVSWEIYGTNDSPLLAANHSAGNDDNWTLISAGMDSGLLADPGRLAPGTTQSFVNSTSYTSYRMGFPSLRDNALANSMQLGEAEFFSDAAGTSPITLAGSPVLGFDPDVVSQSNYPAAEGPGFVADVDSDTKYLNFGEANSGFIATPGIGPSTFGSLRFTTANDAPERDPLTYALYGTNDPITTLDNGQGVDENWTLISSGSTGFDTDPGRFVAGAEIPITHTTPFASYRMVFPTVRDEALSNSLQIADVEFLAPDLVAVEINRDTGEIRIVADPGAGQNVTFQSYSISSSIAGAINDSAWTSIAGTNGDSNDTWQETSTAGDRLSLAEGDVAANGADDGFTLSPGSGISLGVVWDRVPESLEDISILLLDTTGTLIPASVSYIGSEVKPGDYTGDGVVSIADWPQFQALYGANFSGVTLAEAYLGGDLDGDSDSDIDDYNLFIQAAGGFEALFAVPEPSSLSMFAGLGLLLLGSRKVRRRLKGVKSTLPMLALFIGMTSMTFVDSAQAQTGLNFNTAGGTPTFSIPADEINENGTVGDATAGSGPANLFDDFIGGAIDSDLFFWNYGTTDPPAGGGGEQYASIGDQDGDGTFESKTFFMDYGSPVSSNWFAYAHRLGGDVLADRIGKFEFWFSNSSFNQAVPVSAPDAVFSMLDDDSRLSDNIIRPFPLGDTQTGQHVAVRLSLSGGSLARPGNNPGGHEFRLMTGTSAPIIEVDRSTGEITLLNTGDANGALDLQSYTIDSPGGGLDATGFDGVGNDAGFSGWQIGGGSHSSRLAEASFNSNSTLSAGNAGISLGNAYAAGMNTEDLVFKWTNGNVQGIDTDPVTGAPRGNSLLFDGVVRYVGTPSLTLMCDADGDLDCINDDMDAMYAIEGQAGQFDYDGNGTVGPEDIPGWLAEASTSTNVANPTGRTHAIGDLNLDFEVDSVDLGLLLNNFNSDGGSAAGGVGWFGGDVTMDGAVDSIDLGQLLNNFNFVGNAASAAAVPEPAGQSLLLLALAGCLFASRRR